MLSAFPNPRRRIPVPRRVLRFLARCRRRALIATTIGHLIRCLYYRHGQCQPVGLCKASWIAAIFGLSLRSVKGARQALERLGLVQRIETPHWVRNRYGPKMRINLHWAGEQSSAPPTVDRIVAPERAGAGCGEEASRSPASVLAASPAAPQLVTPAEIAPLSPPFAPEIAPPDSYRELSLREQDNREPVARRATGFFTIMVREAREYARSGAAPRDEEENVPSRVALTSRVVPAPQTVQSRPHPAAPRAAGHVSLPPRPTPAKPPRALPPTLRHITLGDLRDTTRVLALYEQAVAAQRIGRTEAERLMFVALAQHVLAQRPRSPGGLFMHLLTKRLFHVITQAEEDAAQQRLKRVLCGDPPSWGEPSFAPVARRGDVYQE